MFICLIFFVIICNHYYHYYQIDRQYHFVKDQFEVVPHKDLLMVVGFVNPPEGHPLYKPSSTAATTNGDGDETVSGGLRGGSRSGSISVSGAAPASSLPNVLTTAELATTATAVDGVELTDLSRVESNQRQDNDGDIEQALPPQKLSIKPALPQAKVKTKPKAENI